jgi:hypothetical protein
MAMANVLAALNPDLLRIANASARPAKILLLGNRYDDWVVAEKCVESRDRGKVKV